MLDVIKPLGELVAGAATIGTVAVCVGILLLATTRLPRTYEPLTGS
ncbi:hypothetical protein FM104_15280 [Microbacterium esteraromaticum]|uniref:Uncharacterized protein n=1 Tax=Microbacterium esteraromaticum TaxID=57043 RepID=A0A1R4KR17_9MICO|nr:hypothetical protein FM104_15280 [Microbacterium esteraromaticum]